MWWDSPFGCSSLKADVEREKIVGFGISFQGLLYYMILSEKPHDAILLATIEINVVLDFRLCAVSLQF